MSSGPIASTHIFEFNSYRDAGRGLFAHRRRLERVPGLRFYRNVFTGSIGSEGFKFGFVEPRRHLAMCLWEDEAALEQFLEHSPIGRSWRTDTNQYCELRMRPFGAFGSYRGMQPLPATKAGARQAPEGPVAIWTFANIPRHGIAYFWREIRHATDELLGLPGLIAGTAGPEHLYTGAMTFTIWQALPDAIQFAYKTEPHKQVVREVNKQGLLTDSMFVRFSPYAASGEWPAYSRFAMNFQGFSAELRARRVAPARPSG